VDLIRPLERRDIPEVVSLYEFVSRSGSRTPAPALGNYFERTLLDHPWADPDIPSLVYTTPQDRIAGFIGSHVRHLVLDGKPIRLACSGQLVSDPADRSRPAGAMLLRRYFEGPQDVTITDGATEVVRRIWKGLGGSMAYLSSISWVRPLNWRFAGHRALERFGIAGWKPVALPVLWMTQAVADRFPVTSLRIGDPPGRTEDLLPATLLDHLPAISGDLRLQPKYSEEFLVWLFREMAKVTTRGELAKRLIRNDRGRVLGWYIAYLQPRGISQVMQVVAKHRDVDAVLDHLFYDAHRCGSAVLTGQMEPSLFESLTKRRCFLHLSGNFMFHSRNPDIANAILAGQAMITRLEGERWMGHHLERFA
jgi:hypothetical protein